MKNLRFSNELVEGLESFSVSMERQGLRYDLHHTSIPLAQSSNVLRLLLQRTSCFHEFRSTSHFTPSRKSPPKACPDKGLYQQIQGLQLKESVSDEAYTPLFDVFVAKIGNLGAAARCSPNTGRWINLRVRLCCETMPGQYLARDGCSSIIGHLINIRRCSSNRCLETFPLSSARSDSCQATWPEV